MEFFEDTIYQKEMEIAALDSQVQAYRDKLLNLGCSDPGDGETKYPENLSNSNETSTGESSLKSISMKNSAPLPFKLLLKKGNERSESPGSDSSPISVEEHTSEATDGHNFSPEKHSNIFAAGNINNYWEQIRKLDERVREITGEPGAELRNISKSFSRLSLASTDISVDAIKGTLTNEFDQLKHTNTNLSCCPSVHDVFEVPKTSEVLDGGEPQCEEEGKSILHGNGRYGKPELNPNEGVKFFMDNHADFLHKPPLPKRGDPNSCPTHDCGSVDGHPKIVCPTVDAPKFCDKLKRINSLPEIVEMQRQTLRRDSNNRGEEELKLLKEIRKQLISIQSEIKSLKSEKSSPFEDFHMHSLMEAMLHFWL